MKWSQFIVQTYNDNLDEVILFNTLHKGVVALESRTYNNINKYLDGKINGLDSTTLEYLNALKDEEFIIEAKVDEKNNFMHSLLQEWENHDALIIHFLPTTDCNFSCSYCYQDGIQKTHEMNKSDLKVIGKHVKKHLQDNRHIKFLTVTLHGGEPTTNWDIIPNALEMLQRVASEMSVEMNTSIVSNTYLLTPEKANILNEYNWYRLQTTVDGPREIHNRRRKLKDGGATYDEIIQNIKYILNKDILKSIDFRINYDKTNYEDIFRLIDIVAEEFNPKQIYLSFGLITQTFDSDSDAYDYISRNKVYNNSMPSHYLKLYKYATSKGFPLSDSYVFGSLCTGKMRNSMIFSPDGKLYKCLSMVGREQGIIGSWRSDDMFSPGENYFITDYYNSCFEKKCSLIPICHCDCRFDALINSDDFYSIYCRKKILEDINKGILAEKYGG